MTETTETNKSQNPLASPKFVLSAVIVALLVVLGLILAFLPKSTGSAEVVSPTNSITPTIASTSAAVDTSICGLPDGDQSKPVTSPTNTKWELVSKVAVPTSPDDFGPGKTSADGLHSCFAHSPNGALYAGFNMIVLGSSGRNDLLAQNLVVEGPERELMLTQPTGSATQRAPFQLAGFKFVDYSGDRAVIEYAVTTANGSTGSFPMAIQWQDGDWKWVPPATGQPESKQLSDLNGFITWAGV